MDTEKKGLVQKNMKVVVVLGIIVVIAIWVMSGYNFFIKSGESITAQWAQVENQYQRRFDLIPNIVNTVKGVAKQEKDVFGMIADARTKYSGATTADEKAKAASGMESALDRLLVIAESYPTLQSSQAYRDLIVTLEGTENRITVERQKYNDLVRVYDTKVKTFPSSIIAKIFGIAPREYFNVPAESQVVPKVDFNAE